MIKRVLDDQTAFYCDELLTKLIQDERQYDDTINSDFEVKDYFKNVIKNDDHILLCNIEDEKIVGYIYLKPIESNDRKGYLIDGLYVLDNYRNRGIAKNLINEALNQLNDLNIDFIDINVLYKNELAKKLYKNFGFDEFKIQMRKYHN